MKSMVLPRPKSLKTLDITIQDPYEDLLATPVTLPEAEPADPQYEWTIAQGDLPVFSLTPKSVKYVACFIAAGQNNDAAARTVQCRMVKWNGAAWVSVAIVNRSTAAALYYTFNCWFYDVAVGDKVGISLWCTTAGHDVDRDYQARQVHYTRLFNENVGDVLKPMNIVVSTHPDLLSGNGPFSFTSSFYLTAGGDDLTTILAANAEIVVWSMSILYGLGQAGRGDSFNPDGVVSYAHASRHPYYTNNVLPTQIIYRPYGDIS